MAKKKFHNKGAKPKKGTKAGFDRKSLINKILTILHEDPTRTLNYKEASALMHIKDNNTKRLINSCLVELAEKGDLKELYRGKYKLKTKGAYIVGKVDLTQRGSAYIISDDIEKDVFIAQKNLNKAMHHDTVRIYVHAQKRRNHVEGEVVEIIKRHKTEFVGKLQVSDAYAFLIPDGGPMQNDIFIPKERLKEGKEGFKAIVKIVEWPDGHKNPIGEVIEVLGPPGENDVEMHAILAEY
jgi:ribonuclease R